MSLLLAAMLTMAAPQTGTVDAPEPAADGGQRWSILADPCATERTHREEILVCGTAAIPPRLPLPEERGPPDRPTPSNPYVNGTGALLVSTDPCATRSGGCAAGLDLFGGATFLVRAAGKAVDPDSCCEEPGEATNPVMLVRDVVKAIGQGLKKKPDKSKRVPIPLDDLPPEPAAAMR